MGRSGDNISILYHPLRVRCPKRMKKTKREKKGEKENKEKREKRERRKERKSGTRLIRPTLRPLVDEITV